MFRETYKGRKIVVKKGREWGTLMVHVNGEFGVSGHGTGPKDEQKAASNARATIDFIDQAGTVNGGKWPAHWYAPGSYELCEEGHPREIGGMCMHPYCGPDNA